MQHYLWQESFGYYLHPSIPLNDSTLRIADVGTGTGFVVLRVFSYSCDVALIIVTLGYGSWTLLVDSLVR